MKEVRQALRPEFLNRLDEIIIFNRLGKDQIIKIVENQLFNVNERLADKKITLKWDRDAVSGLAELGYDPVYGARPLRRVLQHQLQDLLAVKILSGEVMPGQTVNISWQDNCLRIVS